MIIANPISDLVFKWLMDDKRIARFFLETLLEETIIDVEVNPQELPYHKNMDDKSLVVVLTVIRFDFVATIKTASGEYKKVLIEIQKARNYVDVMRFRNYLAEQYKREDEVETGKGKKLVALPIITVYMLGFKLNEIETSVMHVQRVYVDKVTQQIIYKKDDFTEKLTHDCYIIQIPRIEGKLNTRLEQLLSFFEQKYFIDPKGTYKDYPYKIEDEGIKLIADELHYAGTDPERQKYLASEKEGIRVFNLEKEAIEELIEEKDKVIEENKKEIEENKKVIEERDKALADTLKIIEDLKKKAGL